ncbi:MAG: hypothetical protein ACLFS5_01855 [Spirochaetaceae bacterium]
MMRLAVTLEDNVTPRLRAFGADAPQMLRKVMRRVGSRYRSHMRRNYLKGQMLGRRSGTLYKSVRVRSVKRRNMVEIRPYSPLANIYHTTRQIVIRPRNARALRWFNQAGEPQFAKEVRMSPKPFVTRSYQTFGWDREMIMATQWVINREVKRRFAQGQ